MSARIDKIRMTLLCSVATVFAMFHLYTAYAGILPIMLHRSLHLGGGLVLAYLAYPLHNWEKPRYVLVDLALIVGSLTSAVYIWANYQRLLTRIVFMDPVTTPDKIVALVTIACILVATYRIIGAPMVLIALAGVAYAFFGNLLVGFLAHSGTSLKLFAEEMFLNPGGIYGEPIAVSSTYIFLFIIFGSFLEATGIGDVFLRLATGLVGGMRGGPAKVAVLASSLFGSVSGSAVANVYGTGTFTIPMMKRMGYKPHFAGAVEAVASTGGQIMPPVMGATAFLLADYVGIPYWDVAKAAIIPALLYYISVFWAIDCESAKTGLQGLSKDELPDAGKTLRKNGVLLLPIIGLIYLLGKGYTSSLSAFAAIFMIIIVSLFRRENRLTLRMFGDALYNASKNAIPIILACGTAGIIIKIAMMTGLGLKFVSLILHAAAGNVLLGLFFTMITALILGMGLPTSGAYMITAILAAPALIRMGIPDLNAHLFIFYFACISAITPPVALAAYAAASIAGSNINATGIKAFLTGLVAFIIPYMFAFDDAFLGRGSFTQVGIVFVTAVIGILLFGSGLAGWLKHSMDLFARGLAIVAGLCMISPSIIWSLVGSAMGIVVLLLNGRERLARKVYKGSGGRHD